MIGERDVGESNMPRERFKAITISEDVYTLAQKIVEKYRHSLTRKRIRSVAQLIEDAVIFYVQNELKEDLEKLQNEIIKELSK